MIRIIFAVILMFTTTFAFAKCEIWRTKQRNADGSVIRMAQKRCENSDKRTVRVELKPPGSSQFNTVLKRTQSETEAPTGGGQLRDVDDDGMFEYEETGSCGAGPNCESWIFKIRKGSRGLYPWFKGGYAEFQRISNYYVESGRASCCSWEYHLYKKPNVERSIGQRDFLYIITVGGLSTEEESSTPCFVFKRVRGKWVPSAMPNKRLLALCKLYGPNYTINPPRTVEDE